jgi:tetratricopeptide (TPR) repeat protein
MGGSLMLILCKGQMAKQPYKMPYTGSKVYSLEELCYYVYHNIYSITEEFFEKPLSDWLLNEIKHPVLAKKMENMIQAGENLKNLVVTLLCGCDYYKEEEIRELVTVMDEIVNLPLYQKKKIKADNYLRAGRYGKSLSEYQKLLYGSFAVNFTTEEYGDLLHNQGIAHFYIASFSEAERDFREAFARNNKKDSMKHYLLTLLLEGKDTEFESEATRAGWGAEEILAVKGRYIEARNQCRIPNPKDTDLAAYKEELRTAFANE